MKPAPFLIFFAASTLTWAPLTHAAPPSDFFNKLCSALALKKTPQAPTEVKATEPEISPEPRVMTTPIEVDLTSIGVDRIPGSSILFFKGYVPEPGTLWTFEFMKLKLPIHLFVNSESRVVMMYSKEGLPHAELKKLVPEGSEILGGVRFDQNPKDPEKLRIINSTHFSHFNGPEVLNQNFKLNY